MKKVFFIALIINFLSACGIASFEDVTSVKEYNSLVKQRYILIKELKIHSTSLDKKIKELHDFLITKPPGIGGREILWQKTLPIGTILDVRKVERCADCMFMSRYRVKLNLPFSNEYEIAPVYIDFELLVENKEYIQSIK